MKNDTTHDPQLLSALADGQLRGDALAQAVAQATQTQEGRATWHAYQVLGDVLRSVDLADTRRDADFLARLRQRMEDEDAPRALVLQPDTPAIVAAVDNPPAATRPPIVVVQAANHRWRFAAVAASVVAAAALGWQWMGTGMAPAAAPQLAATQPAVAPVAAPAPAVLAQLPSAAPGAAGGAGSAPAVMLRDPRLDELLAAHRQFGGTSALQMPAGFLRNATFEGSGR